MSEDYWRDYRLQRPGTRGGEQARLEAALSNMTVVPSPPAQPEFAKEPRPARPPRKLTKLDFTIGAVVFLTTWGALLNAFHGDGWGAAVVAFFAGGLATWWWRVALVLAIVGIGLAIFLHSK